MFRLMVLAFTFILMVFTLKQAKTVSEIKVINDVICKDLCKGGK